MSLSLTRTHFLSDWGPILITSFIFNYLLEGPISIVTLGVKASTYDLGVGTTVQSLIVGHLQLEWAWAGDWSFPLPVAKEKVLAVLPEGKSNLPLSADLLCSGPFRGSARTLSCVQM